jgi:hypothetical protein
MIYQRRLRSQCVCLCCVGQIVNAIIAKSLEAQNAAAAAKAARDLVRVTVYPHVICPSVCVVNVWLCSGSTEVCSCKQRVAREVGGLFTKRPGVVRTVRGGGRFRCG